MGSFFPPYVRNFLGGQNLKFFRILPDYVDPKKKPGYSVIPPATVGSFLKSIVTLEHLLASPNQVWLIISAIFYVLFPYDVTGSSSNVSLFSMSFLAERLPPYLVVVTSYYAFFYVTLFLMKWADRPYVRNRTGKLDKLVHDVFYANIGVVIWVSLFENTFVYLWQNGKLPYLSDAEAFGTVKGFAAFFVGVLLMPVWRDAHFYFAHRLLHFRPMYLQVHSLHHRNTDIEPFSGLTMHPIEHVYYYTCVMPCLFLFAFSSPFHLLWCGMHAILAPAASHSGFEDHFQADTFHYMHHKYFECNYAGLAASVLDAMFGTFVSKFRGEEAGQNDDKPHLDAKSNLRSPPSLEFVFYLGSCLAMYVLWARAALNMSSVNASTFFALSAVAGFGPVVLAFVMTFLKEVVVKGRGVGASLVTLVEPFAKKGFVDISVHLTLGTFLTAFPMYAMFYMTY